MRHSFSHFRWAWTAITVASFPLKPAFADGGYFVKQMQAYRDTHWTERQPASAPGQKAVILQDGKTHEILLLQSTYHGPAADFAWVVPVPGLPSRKDVFMANPKVFELVEVATQARQSVELQDPLNSREAMWTPLDLLLTTLGTKAVLPRSGAGAPAVVVHERMEVGDYDVSLLSATGRGVLVDWLNRNGYGFPKDAEPLVDDYVSRKWVFVALRVRSPVQQAQPLLKDVAPIGIRFPTEQLVYPLTISRVSAPARTALLLLILADSFVTCAELPVVTFPAQTEGERGETYEALARRLLSRQSGKALLCEGRGALKTPEPQQGGGLFINANRGPDPLASVALEKDGKRLLPLAGQPCTRFWGELPKEALSDLTFTSSSDPAFALRVHKIARLHVAPLAYLFGTKWGRFLWGVLLVLLLDQLFDCLRGGRNLREMKARIPTEVRRATRWGFSGLVAIIALYVAGLTPHHKGFSNPRWGPFVAGVMSLGLLLAVPLILSLMPKVSPETWAKAIPGFLMSLVVPAFVFLAERGNLAEAFRLSLLGNDLAFLGFHALSVLAFLGFAGLLWSFVVGGVATRDIVQPRQGVGCAFLFLVLVAIIPGVHLFCNAVTAGLSLSPQEARDHQSQAIEEMGAALKAFRSETGAYPKRLTDLTSDRAPTYGLDVSGNEVRLTALPRMPLLKAIPEDPFTGRDYTWVYDVRSPFLVQSGGYRVTVTTTGG